MKYTQSYKWMFSFSTWKVHFFLAVYPLYDLNSINECTAVSCCFISASWLSVCRSNGVGHLIHISALCITNRWSGPLSRRKVASGSGGQRQGLDLGLGFPRNWIRTIWWSLTPALALTVAHRMRICAYVCGALSDQFIYIYTYYFAIFCCTFFCVILGFQGS